MVNVVLGHLIGILAVTIAALKGPTETALVIGPMFALMLICTSFRRATRTACVAMVVCFMFVTLVGVGRVLGGSDRDSIVRASAETTAMLGAVLLAGTAILSAAPLGDILAFYDLIRIPRSVSYVLASSLLSLRRVKEIGERLVRLQNIRSSRRSSVLAKFTMYRRVVLPLIVLLLRSQNSHERSLYVRGFFRRGELLKANIGLRYDVLMVFIFEAASIAFVLVFRI